MPKHGTSAARRSEAWRCWPKNGNGCLTARQMLSPISNCFAYISRSQKIRTKSEMKTWNNRLSGEHKVVEDALRGLRTTNPRGKVAPFDIQERTMSTPEGRESVCFPSLATHKCFNIPTNKCQVTETSIFFRIGSKDFSSSVRDLSRLTVVPFQWTFDQYWTYSVQIIASHGIEYSMV